MKNIQYLPASLYAWMLSIFFGATLLDSVYSRIAFSTFKPSETAGMFSKAADFLLFLGMLVILAAIAAVACAWNLRSAGICYYQPWQSTNSGSLSCSTAQATGQYHKYHKHAQEKQKMHHFEKVRAVSDGLNVLNAILLHCQKGCAEENGEHPRIQGGGQVLNIFHHGPHKYGGCSHSLL